VPPISPGNCGGSAPVAGGTGAIELRFEAQAAVPAALAAMKGSGPIPGVRLFNIARDLHAPYRRSSDAAGSTPPSPACQAAAGWRQAMLAHYRRKWRCRLLAVPYRQQGRRCRRDGAAAEARSTPIIFKAKQGLPAMEIAYAGAPLALARSEDNAALTAALGFEILQQGVDELERLQQEQLRMAAEEEKARQEDEARLQAYYAQRDELRLRQREMKVHERIRQRSESPDRGDPAQRRICRDEPRRTE
jgi:hypothetical protein